MWGSNATIRKLANKVDSIKCRPAHLLPGTAHIAPLCKVYAFMSRLEDAMDKVQHKRPSSAQTLSAVPNADGTIRYTHVNGAVVDYNQRGFPMFEARHMHANVPNPEVWVEFTCYSAGEINRANIKNNLSTTPANYRWHHSHEFRRSADGKLEVKMQLVKQEIHDWARHAGGSAIGKQILGATVCH
jgi:hypothetical protein